MSRRGPGLQPHILSGSGACSLGPLAIVTFPLILEVILVNMVSWSSDISHTEPALDRAMDGQRGWCPMFCSLLQDQPYHWGFLWGKMKMTKKMALVAFSSGDFHKDWDSGVQLPRILSLGNGSNLPKVLEHPLGVAACTGLNPRAVSVPPLSLTCLVAASFVCSLFRHSLARSFIHSGKKDWVPSFPQAHARHQDHRNYSNSRLALKQLLRPRENQRDIPGISRHS